MEPDMVNEPVTRSTEHTAGLHAKNSSSSADATGEGSLCKSSAALWLVHGLRGTSTKGKIDWIEGKLIT